MIQTGDPTGQGKGGQSIWGKPFADELRSTLKVSHPLTHCTARGSYMRVKFNARGVVAMANSGPDTNKSQFFIAYTKQPHLDGKYTIIGKVIDGADSTLDAMERVPVNNKNRPLTEIKLTHVCILSCDTSLNLLMGTASLRFQLTIHSNPIADAQLVSRR